MRLARPVESPPAPQDWEAGLEQLLGWLGIAADRSPAASGERAAVFAPWLGWSPAAFQHGGAPGLPQALFAASYACDHPRNGRLTRGGVDLMLLSPHPAACVPDVPAGPPRLRTSVLDAMLAAARAEGRARIALIVHARQRASLAACGRSAAQGGETLDVLAIEDAIAPLATGRAPWDAIIAMPDLRSTVLALLTATSGLRGVWPMLWFDASSQGACVLRHVGGETLAVAEAGESASLLPLDATALVQTLALSLHHSGASRAAGRLHEAWAALQASGVTTTGRGAGDAPYVNAVADRAFIDLMVRPRTPGRSPRPTWLAINSAEIAISGTRMPALRVIA